MWRCGDAGVRWRLWRSRWRFAFFSFSSAKVNRVPRATRGSTDIATDRLFDCAQLEAQALERRERQHVLATAAAATPPPAAARSTRRRRRRRGRRRRQRRLATTAPLPLPLLLLLSLLFLRLLLALLVRLHISDVRFRDELVSAPLARWIRCCCCCCCRRRRRRCGSREEEGTVTKDAGDRVEHCAQKVRYFCCWDSGWLVGWLDSVGWVV